MIIKLASLENLQDIVNIYNEAIEIQSTADTEKINVSDKLDWFNEHIPTKYPIYVIEKNDKIIAWLSVSSYRKGRKALSQTAEISYYVSEKYRGQGVGKQFIEFILNKAPKLKIKNLFAIIMENNIASIKLLKRYNFKQWAYLPNIANFNGKIRGQFYYGINL